MRVEKWGEQEPLAVATGFCQQAAALKITLGYATYKHGGIMLFAMEQVGHNPPQPWRRFWVTKESALRAAEGLCADAALYLDMVSNKWRPAEDLDFDDFQEHLKAYIENSMH